MTVSLRVAAGRMLRWNQKGREVATPRRGLWIEHNLETGACLACKIGLVMIGRYGLNKATGGFSSEDSNLRKATVNYGPDIFCPVNGCWHHATRRPLGYVVEGLFEKHKWSVNKIDKWLAELAEETDNG